MATVSADVKLRNKVASIDGTVILVGAGNVDRVVRFTKLPECLETFKTEIEERKGDSVTKRMAYPVVLNLDRGPHQEAWAQAKREAFLQARRDRPMPEPLEVSPDNKTGWSLDAEDVPVIEIFEQDKTESENRGFVCATCTVGFNTENGLKIHQSRTKHA